MIFGKTDKEKEEWHKVFVFIKRLDDDRIAIFQRVEKRKVISLFGIWDEYRELRK